MDDDTKDPDSSEIVRDEDAVKIVSISPYHIENDTDNITIGVVFNRAPNFVSVSGIDNWSLDGNVLLIMCPGIGFRHYYPDSEIDNDEDKNKITVRWHLGSRVIGSCF